MRIAILGTRGVPANYGGFETFAEECAAGLAARGHRVTVYGRSHYVPRHKKTYRGIDLVVLPTIRLKYLDTVAHTFVSMLHALPRRYDAVLVCNAANSIFAWMPRCVGTPVAVNVDGIERLRGKWNRLGKAWYRVGEYLSTLLPNLIVTDARVIERYYLETYRAPSVFIPYGASTRRPEGRGRLDRLGLEPGGYFLYVSRLEPENNAHLVVRAFERVQTSMRLAIVGDAPYARKYIRALKGTKDERVIFPGGIYGEDYRRLLAHAACYVHATEVGGTHPALIEAMGLGCLIVANGTPENLEVLGGAGLAYPKNDVAEMTRLMQEIADDPARHARLREAALERARAEYSWEEVVRRYEELFAGLCADRGAAS